MELRRAKWWLSCLSIDRLVQRRFTRRRWIGETIGTMAIVRQSDRRRTEIPDSRLWRGDQRASAKAWRPSLYYHIRVSLCRARRNHRGLWHAGNRPPGRDRRRSLDRGWPHLRNNSFLAKTSG